MLLTEAFNHLPNRRRPPKRALKFISDIALPLAGLSRQEASHKARLYANGYTGACGSAEGYFKDTLTQLNTGRYSSRPYLQPRIGVYHDEEGVPVLLRKKRAESTALTLAPLAIRDMVLPRGAIVAVDPSINENPTGERERTHYTLGTFLLPEEAPIHPLRMSAWAFADPQDRASFALSGRLSQGVDAFYFEQDQAEMLERTSLEDFVDAGRRAVELCAE